MNEWTEEEERKKLLTTGRKKILAFEKKEARGRWCELRYERQTPKDSSFLSLLSHTHTHKHWAQWAMVVSTGNPFSITFGYKNRKFIVIFFASSTQLTTNWMSLYKELDSLPLRKHTHTLSPCLFLSDVWWHDYPNIVNSNILNHG